VELIVAVTFDSFGGMIAAGMDGKSKDIVNVLLESFCGPLRIVNDVGPGGTAGCIVEFVAMAASPLVDTDASGHNILNQIAWIHVRSVPFVAADWKLLAGDSGTPGPIPGHTSRIGSLQAVDPVCDADLVEIVLH
jgi:hypothetical protein